MGSIFLTPEYIQLREDATKYWNHTCKDCGKFTLDNDSLLIFISDIGKLKELTAKDVDLLCPKCFYPKVQKIKEDVLRRKNEKIAFPVKKQKVMRKRLRRVQVMPVIYQSKPDNDAFNILY